ncbi:hypothetical protein N9903_01010 [bacterium]|nr:hypothetical protein [bacterium]
MWVRASIDEVNDTNDLVDMLTQRWSRMKPEVKVSWRRETSLHKNDPPQLRLKAFVGLANELGYRVVVLIKNFDKVFLKMSGELLAAMRDLEQDSILCCINTSPLSYGDLYDLRARDERGFSSDYGQGHPRLRLEPYSLEEAKEVWCNDLKMSMETRGKRAYFAVAYEATGGLSTLLIKAAYLAANSRSDSMTIPAFKKYLSDQLIDSFSRFFDYDELSLVWSVARVHLGNPGVKDLRNLTTHRWADIILREPQDGNSLICEALGRKAMSLLRKRSDGDEIDPKKVYMQGLYGACLQDLVEMGESSYPVLYPAANMMQLVYGDSPRNLYYCDVQWSKVKELADLAGSRCRGSSAKEEFVWWGRIAEALGKRDAFEKDDIDKYLLDKSDLPTAAEDAFIYLGSRALAVLRDKNPITSVYVAIPIAEDVLRNYAVFVLGVPTCGKAFVDVRDDEINEWWSRSKFNRPSMDERLSATHLAIVVAIYSNRSVRKVFTSSKQLQKLLTVLDSKRNLAGHYVTVPTEKERTVFIEESINLVRVYGEHAEVEFSLEELEHRLSPPMAFLEERRK